MPTESTTASEANEEAVAAGPETKPSPGEGSPQAGETLETESVLHSLDEGEGGGPEEECDDGVVLLEPDPQILALEQTVSELQARLRAVSAAYKQQQDDMAAARERLARQAALKEEVRRGEVVATLFEPVQNLQRSIDAGLKGSSMEDMLKGLGMLQHQFMEAFKGLGLEEVPGQGTRFNPNLHEALSLVPVTDAALDDVVIEVFSSGYRIGNRLITPARVIVGEYRQPEVEEAEGEAVEVIDVEEVDGVAGSESAGEESGDAEA